jgi:serine protease Do
MQKLIADVEPSVVALVVSHNPKHKIPDASRPWELGEYASPFVPNFRGRQTQERDKLDPSDSRNAGDFTVGSGIVLDGANGLIATCYHLLDGAKKIYVRMPGGGSYADIVAGDSRSDLAVIRVRAPSPKIKTVTFADVRTQELRTAKATVARGQMVVSVAHPFGTGFADGQASASWGIISNVGRKGALLPGADDARPGYLYQYSSLIQTDARLNIGCSGGGIFNLNGELIAMSSTIAGVAGSESAGGFGIPMDLVYRGILETLQKGHEVEYGFLGVQLSGFSGSGDSAGLAVTGITSEGPAERAGMQPTDLIHSINGRPLRDETDLYLYVGGALAGRDASVEVIRGNQKKTIRVQLAKFQHPYSFIASEKSPSFHGLRVEYSSMMVQQVFFGPRGIPQIKLSGVIVRELEPNSKAEAAFKNLPATQGRWLITKVNGIATPTPQTFYAAARDRQTLELTLVSAMGGTDVRKVTLP